MARRLTCLVVLIGLGGCRGDHVSADRCLAFYVREEECVEHFDPAQIDRATLTGAYCAHEVDRDSIAKQVHCVDAPTCDAFAACLYPYQDHGPPIFGVPR